jgi:hypothetical protein
MQAPDMQEHIAYRYLAAGASIIPLQRRAKNPHFGLLPDKTWTQFQQRRANAQEVAGWIEHGAENWGLICGLVSDRIYCGDVDDMTMARWVLDDPTRPVFRGACIVRSGSGKAHIWFRSKTKVLSGVWYLTNRSNHAGDIRGDGRGNAGPSYMVVPPSLHPDTGKEYKEVTGDFNHLPDVEDGQAFLRAIGDAYLSENPTEGGKWMQSNDKAILVLDDIEKKDTLESIRALNLKKKILDTLMIPGSNFPGSRNWTDAPSDSEIYFGVICELIRKGVDAQHAERIFACAPLGGVIYRNKDRPNHGYGWLKYTYDQARIEVDRGLQAARSASGGNFKVEHVTRKDLGPRESLYTLEIHIPNPTDPNAPVRVEHVVVTELDLFDDRAFAKSVATQIHWIPTFMPSQRGHSFVGFGQAVMDMTEEVTRGPRASTEAGQAAEVVLKMIRYMTDRAMPASSGDVSTVGWLSGGTYYLRFGEVITRLRGHNHNFKGIVVLQALDMLGVHNTEQYRYPADNSWEQVVRLVPHQQQGHLWVVPPEPSA